MSNHLSFYQYVSDRIDNTCKTYLLFDELQVVSDWEKAIESFRLDYDVDIYITGSNAYLLSSEFATLLSGRYDIKGKQLLKTLDKNYIVDLGFRNMLLGYRDADRGHILENIVFLELIRRHYRVFIGKIGDTEIE